jgi:hypothetical protein
MLNEGNQIHNFISSSGSGTVIGSDFLMSYGSGSGSTSQKVTVPTVVPVLVPQHWGGGGPMLPSLTDKVLTVVLGGGHGGGWGGGGPMLRSLTDKVLTVVR